jgi:hypothetical protein
MPENFVTLCCIRGGVSSAPAHCRHLRQHLQPAISPAVADRSVRVPNEHIFAGRRIPGYYVPPNGCIDQTSAVDMSDVGARVHTCLVSSE